MLAGAALADITPPLDVGLLMSSVESRWAPFEFVRMGLKARVLALDFSGQKVALVALDLLGLNSKAVGGWPRFKRALTPNIKGLRPSHVVVACTHSHTAPESVGLTNLCSTPQFRGWIAQLQHAISGAIDEAFASAEPCTVSLISSSLRDYSLQRRIPTESGIKMSDGLQPIPADWLDREPIDHRVRALAFRACDGTGIATMAMAACHPVHEMCIPRISPDFPGEFCAAIAGCGNMGVPLFFNGTAGDINPPTVSVGPEAAMRHGRALAATVVNASSKAESIVATPFKFLRRSLPLPVRPIIEGASRHPCLARMSALRIGPLAILLLPGEIFVETGRAIERGSPFKNTIVIGFAESTIGYVPTPKAFEEGGYEIGPGKWSFLESTAAPLLVKGALSLLQELRQGGTDSRGSRKSKPTSVMAR
jgi:hypothetical protein